MTTHRMEAYVQIIYLIRVKYQEFIKNSYNSTKDKHPNLKMGKGLEHTFLQRRYTNAQQAHEKMLNLVIKGLSTDTCCMDEPWKTC